ncbi:MAG: hypothetical protein JO121_10290 [Deltaproteobacteria bacterium]|nr:hypothetical protein [Deltaproteobacteria bacterium]
MRRKQVATVEEVGARLEEWRQNRQGRAAIPDELWSAAIEAARRDGLGRTAAALRLDYGKLKRLMMGAQGVEKKSASPSFMELIAPDAAAVAQCAIEMEGRRARIRIELKASAAEVVSISRALAELVL